MRLKIIDLYIIKQFVQTLFFGLISFIVIFIIIDMMENLDDFVDQSVSFFTVIKYYLYFIPEIVRLISPVSVLFAGMFTTGKMSNQNEVTALKSSGLSMYRFMMPMILVTVIFSIGSVYFGGYLVPHTNRLKYFIDVNDLRKSAVSIDNNIFFQDSKNRVVNISIYNPNDQNIYNSSIHEFSDTNVTVLTRRLDFSRAAFDSTKNAWVAYQCYENIFFGEKSQAHYYPQITLDFLRFAPEDLEYKQKRSEHMNLSELSKVVKDKISAGIDPKNTIIDYHSRYAFAFASLISLLFGLPISANKRKSGLALQFGMNILITFIYLGLMKIFEAFGRNGALDPIITAWIVNILFFITAIFNLMRIRQ